MKRLLVVDDDAHALYSQFNCRPCKLASPPKDGVGRFFLFAQHCNALYIFSSNSCDILSSKKRGERQ